MSHIVGLKGQVVIAKDIRGRLGVEPGWIAFQRLVDDHVEVCFLPSEHRNSLKGILAPYVKVKVPVGKEWVEARESAWRSATAGKASERVQGS